MEMYSKTIEELVNYCLYNGLLLKDIVGAVEKKMIESALKHTGGNKLKASEILGITRKTLINKIKKYRIEEEKV